MAMVGSSMAMCGKRRGIFGVGDGLADGDAFDAGDGDDVAQRGFRDVGSLEAGEGKQLGDLGLVQRSVQLGDGDVFASVHASVEHARDGQAPEIVAVVEIRHQNLQRAGGIALRRRNGVDDRLEQRPQILAATFDVR